jgi:hypothetical protein
MKLFRSKLAVSLAAVAGIVTLAMANFGGPQVWCDCVVKRLGPNQERNYFVTPGTFTKQGQPLPGGPHTWNPPVRLNFVGPNPPPQCDYVLLPFAPNDFHFAGDQWNGNIYQGNARWHQGAPPPGGIKIPIPDPSGPGNRLVVIDVDYQINSLGYVRIWVNPVPAPPPGGVPAGPPNWEGKLGALLDNPVPPPEFSAPVTDYRGPDLSSSNVPTVSEWGLIALGLMLLVAGTIVIRRMQARRPQTVTA